MKQCPKCHANISDTAKFCTECGCNIKKYEEEHAQPKARFCPECGTEISKGAFCPECGYNLGNNLNSETTSAATDTFGDDWLSDLESSTSADVADMKAKQSKANMEKALAAFEYEEHIDGTYTITGLKDKTALTVFVPQGVVNISDHAFEGSQMLQVTLPEGLMMIGKRAFAGCKFIEEIKLPSTLRVICDEAFADCTALDIEIRHIFNVGKDVIKNTVPYRKRKEELRREEERRRAEEERKAEEARRRTEEARKAEEARRRAEEARKAEEARRRAEEARKAEEARRRVEEARKAEEARRAEEALKAEKEAAKRAALDEKKRLEGKVRREGEYVYFGSYPQGVLKGLRPFQSDPVDERGFRVYQHAGKYFRYEVPQGASTGYLVEPIKWRILYENEDSMLLISTVALEDRRFDPYGGNYAGSELRAWLNGDFYNKAFNEEAKSKLITIKSRNDASTTEDDNNPNCCEDTEQMVGLVCFFDLTYSSYGFQGDPYADDPARVISHTPYAAAKAGVKYDDPESFGTRVWWWTRSPSASDFRNVCCCMPSGAVRTGFFGSCTFPANDVRGVVPMIWVNKDEYSK